MGEPMNGHYVSTVLCVLFSCLGDPEVTTECALTALLWQSSCISHRCMNAASTRCPTEQHKPSIRALPLPLSPLSYRIRCQGLQYA
jgi:hypothetical protein